MAFCCCARLVAENRDGDGLQITHIAPTILRLFWLPVPQDMAVEALEPEAGALS
jgi:hypothetical protein